MAAGTLTATVKLNDPDPIYYGNERPVAGNVILSFRPIVSDREQQISEFFGPLKISVTFHGRLKSKIKKSNGNSSSTYRGRVDIFSKNLKVFDDSAKITRGEKWPVSFELSFPAGFESRIVGDWAKDARFDSSQEQPLPPSFLNNYYGFSNHYDSFIEYRVGVKVVVPHLPVEIITPEKYNEALIHYQPPKLPRLLEPKYHRWASGERISNEFLLPEEDRPSGFKQKLKAGLKSDFYPHYNFDWVLLAPQRVHLGQPLAFEIHIRPRESECTAVVVPEVRITSFMVALNACTVARVEKQFLTSPEAEHEYTIKTFRGVQEDVGPFSKATDWGKTVRTPPVPESLAGSFKTVNISHLHSMKVSLLFQAAGKTFSSERTFPVELLPPLVETGGSPEASGSSADAGPSSQPLNMQQVDEALPRYEAGLPGYHEAIGSAPAPPTKDTERIVTDTGIR